MWNTLTTTQDIHQASNAVLTQYERPRDQSQSAKNYRASLGANYAGLSVGYVPSVNVDASMAGLFNQVTPEVPSWTQNAGIDMSVYTVDMSAFTPQSVDLTQAAELLQQQQAELLQQQQTSVFPQSQQSEEMLTNVMPADVLLQAPISDILQPFIQQVEIPSIDIPQQPVVDIPQVLSADVSQVLDLASAFSSAETMPPVMPPVDIPAPPSAESVLTEPVISPIDADMSVMDANQAMLAEEMQKQVMYKAQAEAEIEALTNGGASSVPDISASFDNAPVQDAVIDQPVIDEATQHQLDLLASQMPDLPVEEPVVDLSGIDIAE